MGDFKDALREFAGQFNKSEALGRRLIPTFHGSALFDTSPVLVPPPLDNHPIAKAVEKAEGSLRTVTFMEGEAYIVQGLEKDICAHGKTIEQAMSRFNLTVSMEKAIGNYDRINPAPPHFWQMHDGNNGHTGSAVKFNADPEKIAAMRKEPETCEEWRAVAYHLFKILDDIDTLGDMLKPEINGYFKNVQSRLAKRREVCASDGYNVIFYVPETDPGFSPESKALANAMEKMKK